MTRYRYATLNERGKQNHPAMQHALFQLLPEQECAPYYPDIIIDTGEILALEMSGYYDNATDSWWVISLTGQFWRVLREDEIDIYTGTLRLRPSWD